MLKDKYAVHLLAFSQRSVLNKLPNLYGSVDRQYLPRYLLAKVLSQVSEPFRASEKSDYADVIGSVSLSKDPIFVLGHWRSGTTHLTNLLTSDPSFGFVSTQQSFFPYLCIKHQALLKPLMQSLLPATRPMDNMAVSLDYPQEEEFAMNGVSLHSFYHGLFFPSKLEQLFNKYVLFEDITEQELLEWRDHYQTVIKTASYINGYKQLVLKTPMNTARIPQLLALYPNAKFVFISRNPDEVYYSTVNLFRKLLGYYQLQKISTKKIDKLVIYFYQRMMQRYLDTRSQIPSGNLVEVNYETLTESPLETLENIYEALSIPGFEVAKSHFSAYLESVSNYRKNRFVKNESQTKVIKDAWEFSYREFGYT